MNVYYEVMQFYNRYPGKKQIIGRSAEGRAIFALFTGGNGAVGVSQYAMHAREWITARLALFHLKRGVHGGVWVVPLVNPDGALLVQNGLSAVSGGRREFLRELNGGEDFSLWKANAQGVDLNVNFPAGWGEGKSNVFSPAGANFVGEKPLCAPETQALAAFTQAIMPAYTVSWHTKGEEIYWRFRQEKARAARDRRYAELLSRSTGYPLAEAPFSAGGYKDWCVERLHLPAFTVEAGSDRYAHPLGGETFEELKARCGNALYDLSEGFQ